MTTTPINIDYNGLQINATNDDISITLTMDGSDKGLIFKYDKTSGNPKTFKITSAGFNFTDNTNNYTTPISNIALVQTVLGALEVPPNSTTLALNKTMQITDNTTTSTLDINAGVMNVDVDNSGVVVFNQCPQTAIAPTNNNDLTNKTYVDSTIYNITSVNNNQDYFPVFVSSTGTGSQLYIDSITGPFSYNPSNGTLKSPTLVLDQTTNVVRAGSIASTLGYGNNTIALGLNAGLNQGAGSIAIGQNTGSPSSGSPQGTDCIAIGGGAGRNTQGNEAIAIGFGAGATSQGIGAIAIGGNAGGTSQGQYAIGIGSNAHFSGAGNYSIAIGGGAGTANQAANSIIINASGTNVQNTTASSCVIRPIRGIAQGIGVGRLFYNTTTFEIAYSTT